MVGLLSKADCVNNVADVQWIEHFEFGPKIERSFESPAVIQDVSTSELIKQLSEIDGGAGEHQVVAWASAPKSLSMSTFGMHEFRPR
jgi:hypothetical protein